MAEVLLRHRLEQAGVDARVSSAGLYPGGRPATPHGQATVAQRGLDLSGFTSRRLSRTLIEEADLIVTMAREHVREVAADVPEALGRTFTLKELVRLGTAVGPRPSGSSLASWLASVSADRRREPLLGVGHDDAYDVEDPVGRGRNDYEATAEEIDELLARLVALAWPDATGHEQERSA